jgi:hypothetical protein
MTAMLVFNFVAWTVFTVGAREDIKDIKSVIEKCNVNE